MNDRLYLQLVPDDNDVAALVTVQGHLRQLGLTGRFADPSRLHMTVIHFGDLQQSFDEMTVWSPQLTRELFIENIAHLVSEYEKLLPFRSKVGLKELLFFGETGTTIALGVEVDENMRVFHQRALLHLRTFFAQCGVEFVDAFMKGSINFRHAATFSPHITLIYSAQMLGELSLPSALQKTINVSSSPIIHRNL